MLLAKDIMTTQVITVQPDTIIKDAMNLLVEIQISGLIVTSENNDVLGVISEKDLMVAYDYLKEIKAPIADFVNKDTISVTAETPVEEVSHILVENNIKRVPVVREGKLAGVISRRDILKAILHGKDKL